MSSTSCLRQLFILLICLLSWGCGKNGPARCEELGDPGCPCAEDDFCREDNQGNAYTCSEGICAEVGCEVGRLECPCSADGRCLEALVCDDSQEEAVCVQDCEPGTVGCRCSSSDRCSSSPGDILVCEDDECRAPLCEPGTLDCVCRLDAGCDDALICHNERCVEDRGQTLVPPEDPQCYSPCRGGGLERQAEGESRYDGCDDDGLIPGCLDDSVCVQGSCVRPSESEPGTCATDGDCPSFQSCIERHCYSDCEVDKDCRDGRVCHRKACRLPCENEESTCPSASFCETGNGESGFCMPLVQSLTVSASQPSAENSATFSLAPQVVELSNAIAEGTFSIESHSVATETFVIRKALHREYGGQTPKPVTKDALSWLEVEADGLETNDEGEMSVEIAPGQTLVVSLSSADNPEHDYYDGILEVEHATLGIQEVSLSFSRLPEGQWAGEMYYLANFGTVGLDQWRRNKDDDASARALGNAFVRRWHALRKGRISLREFKAVITATRDETWKTESVRNRCPSEENPNPSVGCYLYDNPSGIAVYSDFLGDNPIPSGLTEFPFAMNVRLDQDSDDEGRDWSGRVVTEQALQYGGNPAVELAFASDPSRCAQTAGGNCLTFVDSFKVDSVVGGRYPTTATDTSCAAAPPGRFEHVAIPWLVPGFEKEAQLDAANGVLMRYECRDRRFPLGSEAQHLAANLSHAASNPLTSGAALGRKLRLVDGALINQSELFLLFEERFPSPVDSEDDAGVSAYGFMVLTRSSARLEPGEFQGAVLQDDSVVPAPPEIGCDPKIVEDVLGAGGELNAGTVDDLGQVVVNGVPSAALAVSPIDADHAEKVHYYCQDTGYFDGGPTADAEGDPVDHHPVLCPGGSKVEFFTVQDDPVTAEVEGSQEWIDGLECQTTPGTCRAGQPCTRPIECAEVYSGTPGQDRDPGACAFAEGGCTVDSRCESKGRCGDVLDRWKADALSVGAVDGDYGPLPSAGARNQAEAIRFRPDPPTTCKEGGGTLDASGSQASCMLDRYDLRSDLDFYPHTPASEPVYSSLVNEIDQAFRYKTKFRIREGTSLGFTPEVCVSDSDVLPYCYDPQAIEQLRERVDCATHIYSEWYDVLAPETRSLLKSYLRRNFANVAVHVPGQAIPVTFDGFEHLNAELLVMLGDEAMALAASSRFDLAGQRVAPFLGDLLEPGGIRLSGGAGLEMFSLYLAAQYYQEALDRFFRYGNAIETSIGGGPDDLPEGEGFITQATATSWLDRLINASSHKARAWSEVARRYQSFNRPELARTVIERGYTAAYLEAALFSRIMVKLTETADAADRAQIAERIERAQFVYRRALQEMRTTYETITDEVTFFGYAPDYVPFPAIDPASPLNAFEEVLGRAQQRLLAAAEKEQAALAETREFETDSAEFQSELSSLTAEYNAQLLDLCGGLEVVDPGTTDRRIVPAIPEYAALEDRLTPHGNPCGRLGTGQIYEARTEVELQTLEFDAVKLATRHLQEKILGAEQRAREHCQSAVDYASWSMEQENEKITLGTTIDSLNLTVDTVDRFMGLLKTSSQIMRCNPMGGECAVAGAITTGFNTAGAIVGGIITGIKALNIGLETRKRTIEAAQVKEGILQDCDSMYIDTKFVVKDLFRQATELEVKAVSQAISVDLAVSRVRSLENQVTSLIATREEARSNLVRVTEARNDPNIRIYTQDSVFAAERTYRRVLEEAYKATRVFEYYTNQSYAPRDDLYLVRMVQYGEPSLEQYLENLEDAYLDYEEQFGTPDLRVALVSMRDDILQIPYLGEGGVALSRAERVERFRQELTKSELLDARGYISTSFATRIDDVSPLTFNHKIRFIEAEIVGEENVGDQLGRVYLTAAGTGTVRTADSGLSFFALPERTAVLDTFFNGDRSLSRGLRTGEDVYRNERLRDRPLVNQDWRLVINQKDEAVNLDIDLASLDDIRLYLFYTDFTGAN